MPDVLQQSNSTLDINDLVEAAVAPTFSYWDSQEAKRLFGATDCLSAAVSLHEKIDICATKADQSNSNKLTNKYLLLKNRINLH